MYYNRLTGTFLEVDDPSNILDGVAKPESPPYGATDEERETQLEWARYYRLPLFLRYVYCFINTCAIVDKYNESMI